MGGLVPAACPRGHSWKHGLLLPTGPVVSAAATHRELSLGVAACG